MQTYYSIEATKTTPAWDYLTDAQVKNYLKQEANVTAENTLITALTNAAQSQFEQMTNRALCDGTLSARYYDIESKGTQIDITIPYRCTYSNISISYKYKNTTEALVENTDYYVNQNRISINKSAFNYVSTGIEIILTATLTADFVDPNVEPALYKMIADLYNYRGNDVVGESVGRLSNTTKFLLEPFMDVNQMI